MKYLVFLILFIFHFGLDAQNMRIGLYDRYEVHKIYIANSKGEYHLFGDSTEFKFTETIYISASADSIYVKSDAKYYGKFKKLRLTAKSHSNIFRIKCLDPSIKEHTFDDELEVSSDHGHLSIVNVVDMVNYLSGVIQSEGGGGRELEYYKVQALISRTYALKNLNKHSKDGFNLCDATHCQAYHNRNTTGTTIRQSVLETKDQIMVSLEGDLIGTYFHASCGGQTSDASYVWNTSLSYCTPFIDTFCIHSKQANWTKTIGKWQWENYLTTEYNLDLKNPLVKDQMYNFTQEVRKAFYIHPSLGIPLRDIRTQFKLKSTFFDVELNGNEVVLKGHGFGHGVGLCQEGAMKMAENGYNYLQIAGYYFDQIRVMTYSEYLVYKEELEDQF